MSFPTPALIPPHIKEWLDTVNELDVLQTLEGMIDDRIEFLYDQEDEDDEDDDE